MEYLRSISHDIFCIFKLFHQNTPIIKDNDILRSHYELLFFLRDNPKTPMSVIAKALSLSKPYITSLVDLLAAKKLVIRVQSETDRRITNISLTSEGLIFINGHEQILVDNFSKKFKGFTKEEIAELKTASKKLRALLEKIECE